MDIDFTLQTPRLQLRRWQNSDLPAFARMNADPAVMEFFPALLSPAQSDSLAAGIREHLDAQGWGLWAVQVHGGPQFIGFVGLSVPRFEASFTPAVEVGWRLARSAWGRGYATEAARAALRDGFDRVGLDAVVSFTTAANTRSRAVMARLGMTHDPADDFDHPALAPGDPLRRHVLYRLRREHLATLRRHERSHRTRHRRPLGAGHAAVRLPDRTRMARADGRPAGRRSCAPVRERRLLRARPASGHASGKGEETAADEGADHGIHARHERRSTSRAT